VKKLAAFGFSHVQAQGLLAGIDAQKISVHALFAQDVVADHAVGIPVDRMLQPDHVHSILGQAVGEIGQDGGLLEGQHVQIFEEIHRSFLA